MDSNFILVALIIAVALAFDYINGFHDAANSIATVVATRVLKPGHAVIWAGFWNLCAVFVLDTGVASTVGKGMVDLKIVTPYVILAGLLGAIVWDLLTWWWGLPTSSSHALLGGYGGAAMAKVALTQGVWRIFDALVISGWVKMIAFIIIAPMLGMTLAYLLMVAVHWIFRSTMPGSFPPMGGSCLSIFYVTPDENFSPDPASALRCSLSHNARGHRHRKSVRPDR